MPESMVKLSLARNTEPLEEEFVSNWYSYKSSHRGINVLLLLIET